MGIYARISQNCIVCAEPSSRVVCQACEDEFGVQEQRCLSCAAPLNQSLDYCGNCLRTSPSFHHAYTLYDYEDVIAYLIKKMKYDARLSVAQFFSEKIAEKIGEMQALGHHYDVIIPMPLHKNRLRERGYNQVVEMLRGLDKKGVVDTTSVQRLKSTAPLTDLPLAQRKKEIKGAFSLAEPLTHKRILLVDDVMTSGSSLNELAKTILKQSPAVICCDVLTLSRAQLNEP
ncbi:MAG: ComF family protein [Gammaproteobacteria bacterium]